jgi:hypothetical protein
MTEANWTGWAQDVEQAMRAVAGDAWADEVAAAWRRHADRPVVEVTLYGPYDAGKSSLLKRLLVEDGTPVPEWLTVSARRETFELNEIRSGELAFTDTPGIATSDQRHEEIGNEAVTLTDSLIVVLPPQLVTSDQEQILSIVRGGFYTAAGGPVFPPRALLLVIAQADTAGVDPSDDQAAYDELCRRKRSELLELLGRYAAGGRELPVHTVAADPYGLVGTTRQPRLEDYANGSSWDGVDGLRSDLRSLASRRSELRDAAAVRYWSWIGLQARARADAELARLAQTIEEAQRQLHRIAMLESELGAVNTAASAELRGAVHQELKAVADSSPGESLDSIQSTAEQRLEKSVGAWALKWQVRLEQLARGAETELDVQAQRSGGAAFRSYLSDLLDAGAQPAPPQDETRLRGIIGRLDQSVRQMVRTGYELRLGMSLDEARDELRQLENLESRLMTSFLTAHSQAGDGEEEQFAEIAAWFLDTGGSLRSETTEQLRRGLHRAKLIEQTVPLLVELGSFAAAEVQQRSLARAEQERRTKLRSTVERLATDIADRVLGGEQAEGMSWNQAVAWLRERIQAGRPPEALLDASRQRQEQLTTAQSALTALLEEPPFPKTAADDVERR